jgi:hypothetical protein
MYVFQFKKNHLKPPTVQQQFQLVYQAEQKRREKQARRMERFRKSK